MPNTPATTTASAPSANTMTTTTNLLATGTTGSGPQNSQNTSLSSDDTTKESRDVSFTPTGCLFCPAESDDMASNVLHMQQKHGLFIPQTVVGVRDGITKRLVVDTETLLRYMHLVISGDHQCLFCQKQCRGVLAVQHHMTSRGHCRMDLDEGSDSEFLDFYEVSDDDDDDDDDAGVDGLNIIHLHQDLGRDTRQLSSGKVVSHRSAAPTPKPNRQPLAEPENRPRYGPVGDLVGSIVVGHQKGAVALPRALRKTLARMPRSDLASLAHLSLAEQRAKATTWYRQMKSDASRQCAAVMVSKQSANRAGGGCGR